MRRSLILLTRLNEERPIRRLGVTRRKLLGEIDRPALKALKNPYVFAEWRICRGQHRPLRRGQGALLQRPTSLRPRRGGALHRPHRIEIFHEGELVAAHSA
ncbi:hypothetical protein ACFIOY_18050 [Bradyrhizobium sp. TZ2]